jgi:hypothetical protein
MSSTGIDIDFNAPATLRKSPSLNNERVSASLDARPYPDLVVDRSLDEGIRQFLAKSATQRHLRDSHRATNRRAPDARSITSRHSSFGFNQWMLWFQSAVKCARDSWQRLPGRKQSERQNKAKKPAPNPVLRRETVLELAQIVREARSRQSRKVCVA